jgi:Flp pilus assembly protein TadG
MSRHTIKNEQGQTMVEFALVIPVLLVILFGVIQFGVLYNNYVTLTDATRAGARKAAVSRQDPDRVPAVIAKVEASASGLDDDLDVVVTAPAGWEHGEDVTVQATYPYEINLMGLVVAAGDLQSTTTERIE